jgi:mannose/fructose/sorbose-specific phosphotransferase system IIB component
MSITLVRIDDRLIHGQIVEGWLKTIEVDHIMVISDYVAGDKMQQILLNMAAPNNIKVTSFSVADGAKKLKEEAFKNDSVLVLVSSPRDILALLNLGVKFQSVNVGGMHYAQGKKQLLRNLSVNDQDIESFNNISRMGVELEGRVLPSDERINIMEVIEKSVKEDIEKEEKQQSL